MGEVPTGTVTFLFTDVEGSTRLWADDSEAMSVSLQLHDSILREAIASADGYVFTTAGDAFCAAFSRASDAVLCAESVQTSLANADWPGPALKVRMGMHLGEAEERGGDYFGPVVNTAARVEAAGHGGQVLMTDAVRAAASLSPTDLGVHELRDVSEPVRIWQLDNVEFPSLRLVDSVLTNLPRAASEMIGRAVDLRRVREGLRSNRWVTLTAGGGTGKTRLALAVGEEELPHRDDGVWFVDLTTVSDAGQIGSAVAAGLGLGLVVGDALQQVLAYMENKDLLLIIDNCEHLIDECAELAERFLTSHGAATVLATSRERLDVDGEQSLQIPPLATDDESDSSAVDLFARRALAVNSSFSLSEESRAVVAQLCRRLDGVPLAIELAAARSAVMSPAELLAGIEDRFRLLHGGRRRQRQRTLEATLDWSYNLLESDEQQVLRALGVFVGNFDLDAVAAVVDLTRATAMDLIDSLITKSLVVRQELDGQSRFRVFETTAAYAEMRLVDEHESVAVRDRHLDHFLELSLRHYPGMNADQGARSLLGHDRINIVGAFEWAASKSDWARASRLLLGAFTVFYDHPTQGVGLLDRCVENLSDDEHDLAMRLVCNSFTLHFMISDIDPGHAAIRSLRNSPDPLHQVWGYGYLSFLFAPSDTTVALELLDQTVSIREALPPGPDAIQASSFCEQIAGVLAVLGGDPDLALQTSRAGIALTEELEFESETFAHAVMMEAVTCLILGDPAAALHAANRYAQLRPAFGTGDEIRALAHVALGDLETARAAIRSQARVAVSGRLVRQATDSLLVLAVLAEAEGEMAIAREMILDMGMCGHAELLGYANHFAERLGIGAEFSAAQMPLWVDGGEIIRTRAKNDVAKLRTEMIRRGWA